MSDDQSDHAPERLDQELRALRAALRKIDAPADEAALVAAARRLATRAAVAPTALPVEPVRAPRRYAALATAATVVLAALTTFAWMRSGGVPASAAAPAVPMAADVGPAAVDPQAATPAFRLLSYGPGFSPAASYNIVRVRIPLSSLAHGAPLDASIEADLLVGEDGLASGIRFNPADTLVVSATSP